MVCTKCKTEQNKKQQQQQKYPKHFSGGDNRNSIVKPFGEIDV